MNELIKDILGVSLVIILLIIFFMIFCVMNYLGILASHYLLTGIYNGQFVWQWSLYDNLATYEINVTRHIIFWLGFMTILAAPGLLIDLIGFIIRKIKKKKK